MQTIHVLLLLGVLTGCGGGAEHTEPAAPAPQANNPLAAEQQTLRDAAAIQGLLDKNAEEKKKAVNNAN